MDQLVRGYRTKRMTRRVSALNPIVYLFLNQGAFGSRVRPTHSSLLISWGKSWQVIKISNQATPLLVSWVKTKIMPSGATQKKR